MPKYSMDNQYYEFCINNASSWLRRRGETGGLGMVEFGAAMEAIAACWCISPERVVNDLILAGAPVPKEGQ